MKKTEDSGEKFRQTLPESRRIVVKIGSKVIVDPRGRPDRRRPRRDKDYNSHQGFPKAPPRTDERQQKHRAHCGCVHYNWC